MTARDLDPGLDANILPGYDFISDATAARDGNGRDDHPADEGDWNSTSGCSTSNSSWHGTDAAGTVAAVTTTTSVAGTAFNAKVVPVRVLGRCGGSLSDIADAIIWASGGSVSGVPANANVAEVINMSLGGGSCSSSYQNAINSAVSRGTTVVVAACTSAANVSGSLPANCANVIAVAATTSAGAKASYSNFGAGIDVSASGSGILSTLNSGTTTPGTPSYTSYNGTSMAAPHVAGVVALMQSVAFNPLTPATVKALLKASARPLPVACTQGGGAGLVNADGAVAAVIASTTLTRNCGTHAAERSALRFAVLPGQCARWHTFAQGHARRWQQQCRPPRYVRVRYRPMLRTAAAACCRAMATAARWPRPPQASIPFA